MSESLREYYTDFAHRWAHGTSPLYEEWALGIAADDALRSRIAELPRPAQQANLLFAAARWEGCPLSAFAPWRDWLEEHWDAVVATALTRSTQTNEVNRCATLLPVLADLDAPLALLEVGAAGGLCLLPDRYSYTYETPSGVRRLDPATGPGTVQLSCRVDDETSVPTTLPDVVWRQGIDLNPIDVADAASVDWLATLIWPGPDHDARVDRLRAAAGTLAALSDAERPRIARGDLLDRLVDVAAQSPAEATLVVFHSAVLMYLDPTGRERFAAVMATLGDAISRRVVWLSNEAAGTFAEIDARLPAGLDTSHRFVQTRDGVPVALAGQHGASYERRGLSGAVSA